MRVENLLVNNTAFSLAVVSIVDNKIVAKGFTHTDDMVTLSIGIEDLEIWHIRKPEPKIEDPEPEAQAQPEPAVLTETSVSIEKRKRGRPRKIVA